MRNFASVECDGAEALHLPEDICVKDMKIRHTKKIVVATPGKARTAKTCNQFHLHVKHSTIDAIPSTATQLHIARSTVSKLVLQASVENVTINASQVRLLETNTSQSGSVHIRNTTVHYLRNFAASSNAKIKFFGSHIKQMLLGKTFLRDNASLVMGDCKVNVRDTHVLSIPPGVRVKLDKVDGDITIKFHHYKGAVEEEEISVFMVKQSDFETQAHNALSIYIIPVIVILLVLFLAVVLYAMKRKIIKSAVTV